MKSRKGSIQGSNCRREAYHRRHRPSSSASNRLRGSQVPRQNSKKGTVCRRFQVRGRAARG
ncbi:hypothetical protein BD626DRAFT_516777 [Schizophyllum amplum]|uniref:Uncharacterized protein n=1 Tax=Schizophyllum amplum TaxID=97359 RepID=A0A550BWY4_9AGAR|nr:hypothetical protein BD626DRAFT_516777 [Auriculariopsis ampla]